MLTVLYTSIYSIYASPSYSSTAVSLGLERLGTVNTLRVSAGKIIHAFSTWVSICILSMGTEWRISHLQVSVFVNSSPTSAYPLVRLPNGQTVPLLPSPVQMTSVISVRNLQNMKKIQQIMSGFLLQSNCSYSW